MDPEPHQRHPNEVGFIDTALRGLARRCPRCGEGSMFQSFYVMRPKCEVCGLDFFHFGNDTWALMYVTTAGLTGLVLLGIIFSDPLNRVLGSTTVLVVAVLLIPASLPFRKGLGVAINFYRETRGGRRD